MDLIRRIACLSFCLILLLVVPGCQQGIFVANESSANFRPTSVNRLQTLIPGPDPYSTKEFFVPYPTPIRKFFPSPTPWTGVWEDGERMFTSPHYRATNVWQGLVDGRYVFLAAVFPYSVADESGIYYYPHDMPDRPHYFRLEGKQGKLWILKVEDHLVTLRLEKDDSLVYFDLQALQFTRDQNAKLPTATPYIPPPTPMPTSIDWLRTAIPYP